MILIKKILDEVNDILQSYEPLALRQITQVQLMDRMDTKFIFHISLLPGILQELKKSFSVLEIDSRRLLNYGSYYYDTASLLFFRQHHNGKGTRFKVRYRHYMDSDSRFFEIKCKNNKNRTVKKRIKAGAFGDSIKCEEEEFLNTVTGLSDLQLEPALTVHYSRMSLISKSLDERITIDVNVRFSRNGIAGSYPQLVIAELKQHRQQRSEFLKVMKHFHIHPVTISKYCLGISTIFPAIKRNNFKPNIMYVNKLCHE